MRFTWIFAIFVMGVFVLPVIIIFTPYIVFQAYTGYIPAYASVDHLNASSKSVLDVAIVMFCLTLPLGLCTTMLAPGIEHSGFLFQEMILTQRILIERLARHASATDSFSVIAAIERATEYALDAESAVLLQQEDAWTLEDIGGAWGLSDIHHLSRKLLFSMQEVLVQVEVTAARVLFMHYGVGNAIALLNFRNVGAFFGMESSTLPFGVFIQLSANATLDSLYHVRDEVHDAMLHTSTLATTLDHFRRKNRVAQGCTPVTGSICNVTYPLLRGRMVLDPVVDRLAMLEETLKDGIEIMENGGSHVQGPFNYSVDAVHYILEANAQVLRMQVFALWRMRQLTEAGGMNGVWW